MSSTDFSSRLSSIRTHIILAVCTLVTIFNANFIISNTKFIIFNANRYHALL